VGGREADGPGDRGVPPVVCNASPLITLAQIGRLDLLRALFSTVVVSPAVVRETPRTAKPSWIVERPLAGPVPPPVVAASLGPGETETICLALELGASQVILDERRGRRFAQALGIRVIGTVGVLLLAKDRGLLSAVRPEIDALVGTGFRLASWVIDDALATAGEDG
jgi:uncharacterized protein